MDDGSCMEKVFGQIDDVAGIGVQGSNQHSLTLGNTNEKGAAFVWEGHPLKSSR